MSGKVFEPQLVSGVTVLWTVCRALGTGMLTGYVWYPVPQEAPW